MTDDELRTLLADTARLTAENSEQIKQLGTQTTRLGKQIKQLGTQTTRLGKQIGDIGNKFGRFTEGLFFPALVRILAEKFGITNTAPRFRITDAETRQVVMEMDGFGYANSHTNVAVIIEVKTELRDEDIAALLDKLHRFPHVVPEHQRNLKGSL